MKKAFSNIGIKISFITIVINLILFIFKLLVGIHAHSHAMVSDAIHSLSDVLTTILVIIGLIMSLKKADEKHPYGHERIECVFAIILAFILFITGIGIGVAGIRAILLSKKQKLLIPGFSALIVAIISIIIKMIMYLYTIRIAKSLNSSSLMADANHHKMDSLSSIGSFIGVFFARIGFPIFDPLFSVFICLIIIKVSIDIFIEAISQMLDTSCDNEFKNKIVKFVKKDPKIKEILNVKTRMFGSKVYIDLKISLDGNIKLKEVNKIIVNLHDRIEEKFTRVKHCNIVVIPYDKVKK